MPAFHPYWPQPRRWNVQRNPDDLTKVTPVTPVLPGEIYIPWKLTWHWKIPILNRTYIFKWWMFHCHVSFFGGYTKHVHLQNGCSLRNWYTKNSGVFLYDFRDFEGNFGGTVKSHRDGCLVSTWVTFSNACDEVQNITKSYARTWFLRGDCTYVTSKPVEPIYVTSSYFCKTILEFFLFFLI